MLNIVETSDNRSVRGLISTLGKDSEPVSSSEVSVIPGFIDNLELMEKLAIPDSDPMLVSLVPVDAFIGFTNQSGVEWSEETYGLLMGKTRIEWAAGGGLFRRILDRIRGFSLIEESKETRYFPITEIHRPKISGCKAAFSISSEESTDYTFSVKILGFSGGSGAGRSFGRNSTINAIDECLNYCVPVTIRWRAYQNNSDKFVRGDVVNIGDGHEVTAIHEPEDKCGMEGPIVTELGWETRKFLHEQIGGDFTETITVSENRESNWKWGFKFLIPTLGEIEIGFTGAVKTLKKIKYQYELAGNHNYTAYNPPDSISVYWNWVPKT